MRSRWIGWVLTGAVWAVALYLLLTGLFPWAFIGLYALRLLEWFFVGRKTGAKAGVGRWKTALMTMLLGPLWFLPLRRAKKTAALPPSETAPDAAPVIEAEQMPGESFSQAPEAAEPSAEPFAEEPAVGDNEPDAPDAKAGEPAAPGPDPEPPDAP